MTRVGDPCGGEESNTTVHVGASGQKRSEIDDGAAIIDAAQTCLNTQRPLAAPVRVYFWSITRGLSDTLGARV